MTRSKRFLKAIEGYGQVVIVTHDNPDPDAIAAGWALLTLVKAAQHVPVRLVAGGAVVRAENRYMMRVLKPPLELTDRLVVEENTAVVLVDCQPEGANHLVDGRNRTIVAIIDHHERSGPATRIGHRDLRPNVAAASTIAAQYLREQSVEPGAELATALVYAIQTDAHTGNAPLSPTDKRVASWLVARADLQKLASIASAPLAMAYFEDLLLALENTFVYENAGLCFLPTAHCPEIVGEVADLLIRCESIDQMMCAAIVDGDLLVSVRTTPEGGDACALVRQALQGLGYGGGHRHRAGGRVVSPLRSDQISPDLQSYLRGRWLAACGIAPQRGSRLVPRREILEHL